eukprot:CAMPEP_0172493130 /NCGR_PEP_ID=MMETSP1066-20121228/24484_1 /TAXON_ID=671091 /ORGANISM="Coscinodiscus wailesii, Strain CCMP2513" /LENGTH=75 /DNA_ID=CAMNT_0013263133 /DNA_START=290 /DNA_END=517 /DNA_ORIENTATION=-
MAAPPSNSRMGEAYTTTEDLDKSIEDASMDDNSSKPQAEKLNKGTFSGFFNISVTTKGIKKEVDLVERFNLFYDQ